MIEYKFKMVGNRYTEEELNKFQNNLEQMETSKLIELVKEFCRSDDVYYKNTNKNVAKYHEPLPLSYTKMDELITYDYTKLITKKGIDSIQGFTYGPKSRYIDITNGKPQSFTIRIGPQFGTGFGFTWYWFKYHTHHSNKYLYDCFYEKVSRKLKLERIAK